MVGGRIGGVNVFGGGLALYDKHGRRVGGVGVSGNTSCRDHMVPGSCTNNGFGHPNCLDPAGERAAAAALSPVRPVR
jgi:hypothetical protein